MTYHHDVYHMKMTSFGKRPIKRFYNSRKKRRVENNGKYGKKPSIVVAQNLRIAVCPRLCQVGTGLVSSQPLLQRTWDYYARSMWSEFSQSNSCSQVFRPIFSVKDQINVTHNKKVNFTKFSNQNSSGRKRVGQMTKVMNKETPTINSRHKLWLVLFVHCLCRFSFSFSDPWKLGLKHSNLSGHLMI